MSTCGNPSGYINWLFSNPANTQGKVHSAAIPDFSLDASVEQLVEWIVTLEKKFEFRAREATLRFWIVSC